MTPIMPAMPPLRIFGKIENFSLFGHFVMGFVLGPEEVMATWQNGLRLQECRKINSLK